MFSILKWIVIGFIGYYSYQNREYFESLKSFVLERFDRSKDALEDLKLKNQKNNLDRIEDQID